MPRRPASVAQLISSPRAFLLQLFGTTQRLVSNTQLTIKNRGSDAVDSIVICDLASLKEHAALYAVSARGGGGRGLLSIGFSADREGG